MQQNALITAYHRLQCRFYILLAENRLFDYVVELLTERASNLNSYHGHTVLD